MSETNEPFAAWLDATMRARGISQAEVARDLGVADVQVSRWRRGSVTPSVRYLQRIADTFEIPRATLDQLVRYPDADGSVQSEGEPLDPVREAEIQALQARMRDVLEQKLPQTLWQTYGDACEALANELSASFDHVVRETHDKAARGIGFRMNKE